MKRLVNDPCGSGEPEDRLWSRRQAIEDKLRATVARSWPTPKTSGARVYENIPKMMFIFLPLIAVVMFVLYLGSGRFYVEHLLFFVHFHAFFFLSGIVVVVLDALARWLVGTGAGRILKAAESFLLLSSCSTCRTTCIGRCAASTARAAS